MRTILTIFLIFIINGPMLAQPKSVKKGIAYGHHNGADISLVEQNFAWWYNWGAVPEIDHNKVWDSPEYVPMMWSQHSSDSTMRAYLDNHPEVKYLLGWNEPNFAEQANMTPAEAAENWHVLEEIADDYDLKIVGPAVNYSPGNVDIPGTDQDADPWVYLDAFFAACPDCRVDYIAIHCYMGGADDVKWFVTEFERYGLPIWVTEWAAWESWSPTNYNDQLNYCAETTRWMEDNPMVYRYAWYIGRQFSRWNYPYIDIYDQAPGTFTPLGAIYAAIPGNDYHYLIPSQIQAEGFHWQDGFQFEECFDEGGGANIGWSSPGDRISYKVDVPQSGEYMIHLRYANGGGESGYKVNLDQKAVAQDVLVNTGGWQDWNDHFTTLTLDQGKHDLEFEVTSNGFNLNWLSIDFLSQVDDDVRNPLFWRHDRSRDWLILNNTSDLVIKVYSATGQLIVPNTTESGFSTSAWAEGIYFVHVKRQELNAGFSIVVH